MSKIYFAHRPPSTGVHLLSDPFPPRSISPAALQTTEEDVTASKRLAKTVKVKKATLRS